MLSPVFAAATEGGKGEGGKGEGGRGRAEASGELASRYLLPTTYYILLPTHYSPLPTHYLLTTHYSLLTTHHSLLATYYSSFSDSPPITRYSMHNSAGAVDPLLPLLPELKEWVVYGFLLCPEELATPG